MDSRIYKISADHCKQLVSRKKEIFKEFSEVPFDHEAEYLGSPIDKGAFNVNKMLKIFDLISIDPGYQLDYVYGFSGRGGEPLVYARRIEDKPIATVLDYWETFALPRLRGLYGEELTSEDSKPYLQHLRFENSPEGYYQFGLFCFTIRRFYLFWHSLYNERDFILSEDDLNEDYKMAFVDFDQRDLKTLKNLDWHPTVVINGHCGEVSVLNCKMNQGISILKISLEFPNIFVSFKDEVIIPSKGYTLF